MGLRALDRGAGTLGQHHGVSQRGPELCQAQASGTGHSTRDPATLKGGRRWAHTTDGDAEAVEACRVLGS